MEMALYNIRPFAIFVVKRICNSMDLQHAALLLVSHPERKTPGLHHRLYLSPVYIAPGELPYKKDGVAHGKF